MIGSDLKWAWLMCEIGYVISYDICLFIVVINVVTSWLMFFLISLFVTNIV